MFQYFFWCPFGINDTSVFSCSGANIDHIISSFYHFFIVFYDNYGVSNIF